EWKPILGSLFNPRRAIFKDSNVKGSGIIIAPVTK
ncbi:unnamed protein product, partial [marine sediment metagenome]